MKTFIKIYILPSLFFIGLTTQISAQRKRNVKEKTVTTTTTKRIILNNNSSRRVSSRNVTYKRPTRKVTSVRTLPTRSVVRYNGQNYYYANNRYYTRSGGHYTVIAPRVGFRISFLPSNNKRIRFNNLNYYNANGIFYRQIDAQYEVVEPEIGTIIYELPVDYEKVIVDNQMYYEYANILYEKIQVDGTRAYEVVGIVDTE